MKAESFDFDKVKGEKPKIFIPSDKKLKKAVVQYEMLVPEDVNNCDVMYMMMPVYSCKVRLISRRVMEVKDYDENQGYNTPLNPIAL